jgi:hypothetical protein
MVRFIGLVSIGLLLTACNNKLAQRCAETYPCKDSTTYVGIGIPDSTPYIEFVKVPYPETHENIVWRDSGSTKIAYQTELKYKYITRQRVEKIVKVRDTAKEKVLQDRIDELQKQLEKSESKPDVKLPWAVAAIITLIALLLKGKKKNNE